MTQRISKCLVAFGIGSNRFDVETTQVKKRFIWSVFKEHFIYAVSDGIVEDTSEEQIEEFGTETQPCFTPLQMLKGSEASPPESTAPFMLSKNWRISLHISLGSQVFGG